MRRSVWLTGVLIVGMAILGLVIMRSGVLSRFSVADRHESVGTDRGAGGAPAGSRPLAVGLVEALRAGDLAEDALPEPQAADPDDLRVLTRAMLESSIEEYLPGHKLSSDELDRLADATSRVREAQIELRNLPEDPDLADRRRKLKEQIEDSISEFTEIMDMDPSDFTAAVQPGVGLDAYDPDEIVPEGEFIERPAHSEFSQ